MSECTHDCSSCSSNCNEREQPPKAKLNEFSKVKKVYAVVSGKGGVGKSLVTSMLAVEANRRGLKTAILDGDILGPSIPKVFGLKEKAEANENGIFPVVTKKGIEVMSINLLLEDETQPVVWRGPVIAGAVTQFWTDVMWNEVDVMFIDCPPGTGDVPLTIFQSIPVDGIIMVASPQELVSMIVEKAVNMAKLMKIPVVGAVENMAYFVCDKCGEKHYIYGKSDMEKIVKLWGIDNFAQIPFNKDIANLCDRGLIELNECDALVELVNKIL